MCGVVASLPRRDLIGAMRRLAHRGIRSKIANTQVGSMGHVRLPIVGVDSAYDQPAREGSKTIGFVGEILDFKDTMPSAVCDLELAVRMLTEGRDAMPWVHHDGFWGVIVIDDAEETMTVFTDYLGQKPMYYRTDMITAASEIDALVEFGPVTLDEVYLSACIKWGYCPDVERTPYNEVKHLRPGEAIVFKLGEGIIWQGIADPLIPKKLFFPAMKDEITAAIRRRTLSSDVPVASLLSGGVDSSIVHTFAKRYGPVIAYHVTLDDDKKEMDAVDEVAFGSPLVRIAYDENISREDAVREFGEPIDLGSLLPQFTLARTVEERVCLTGDGADEVFGGYERSSRYDSQSSDVFQELPAWHLPRLDRVMMRSQIEVRSPFLARRVVQAALALDFDYRRGDKRVLRELFRDDLPKGLADRPKKALRTKEIADDRETVSKKIVDQFKRDFYEKKAGAK